MGSHEDSPQQMQELSLDPASSNARQVPLRMIGNYCVERTIGRGQFGKVKLAYHKKVPDMKVC